MSASTAIASPLTPCERQRADDLGRKMTGWGIDHLDHAFDLLDRLAPRFTDAVMHSYDEWMADRIASDDPRECWLTANGFDF